MLFFQLWLLLAEDYMADDHRNFGSGVRTFDPTRVPAIPIGSIALDCLLSCLATQSVCPLPTWVLAFQVKAGYSQGVYSKTILPHKKERVETDKKFFSYFINKCIKDLIL